MTMNDEELFEHLQELVAELPAMQEKGAVLARARAAAEVAKRAHYYEGQRNELNGILSEMAEHERQRAIAIGKSLVKLAFRRIGSAFANAALRAARQDKGALRFFAGLGSRSSA